MTERNRKINTVERPGDAWSDLALDTIIEQLWYTWSDVGLSMVGGGFRIRAASEGLHDIHSVRVQNLDQYQRYSLPRGADSGIPLPMAPLCLSLVTIEGEKTRTLVHKAYIGKDLVGRYGAFFIHLLAGLPENFSVVHAISLWESPFWQTSDATLKDRRSTSLDQVSLASLRDEAKKALPLNSKSTPRIQKALPYVIEAYLTKKPIIEPKTRQKAQQETPQKIYIAAPDSDIAQLISGLAHCLPPQLLRDLTFSTYEHDISEATTEITGTCWTSDPKAENDPHIADLLPAQYYQEALAINCYTGQSSQLQGNPLVENKPLAKLFAQDAMSYFTQSAPRELPIQVLTTRFHMLLKLCRGIADLDVGTFSSRVDQFLALYNRLVIKGEDPVKPLLASSDYHYIAEMLSDQFYQDMLIMVAIGEPDWWWAAGKNSGRAALINLRQVSAKIPHLAQALSSIAQRAIPSVVAGVKKEASQSTPIAGGDVSLKISIDMMRCAAPHTVDPAVWIALLEELQDVKPIVVFQHHCWDIYADLMKMWVALLPPSAQNDKLIQHFLVVSWNRFGDLLTLGLPFEWTVQATKDLVVQSPSTLTQAGVHRLEPYHTLIIGLLQRLASDPSYWPTALFLFYNLITVKYAGRRELFRVLLDSPLRQYEEHALKLLSLVSQLPLDEQAFYLQYVGPQYLPLNNKLASEVLDLFRKLAQGARKEKMEVLQRWFASTHLSIWFDMPPDGKSISQRFCSVRF